MRAPVFALAACLGLAFAAAGAHAQDQTIRTVYHLSQGLEEASRGLEYIRNHLEAAPAAQIVVVTHAAGVDFLRKGAKTARGNEYRSMVEDLELQGVEFRVCEITLRERGMRRDQFLPVVRFVPSGVAEIARLQHREGHAYLRP